MRLRLGFLALALTAAWGFVAALASEAEAFDGRRPGFSVELGAGAGVIPAEKRYIDDHFQSRVAFRSKASAVTRLRLGWGLGNHVLVQALDDMVDDG